MQGPGPYNVESYEPTQLRPEEVKQNDNYLKRAFTTQQKIIPKTFNPNIINSININNQIGYNNMINNNYSNNRLIYNNPQFPTNVNFNISGNVLNPLLMNNLKQNNIYAKARNNGVINPYNTLQYNNIPTTRVNFLKNNMSKYIPKVSQIYPTINQPMNMNRTKYYTQSKIHIPIYRTKLNKKKK